VVALLPNYLVILFSKSYYAGDFSVRITGISSGVWHPPCGFIEITGSPIELSATNLKELARFLICVEVEKMTQLF
jgi:hypothetical protein